MPPVTKELLCLARKGSAHIENYPTPLASCRAAAQPIAVALELGGLLPCAQVRLCEQENILWLRAIEDRNHSR